MTDGPTGAQARLGEGEHDSSLLGLGWLRSALRAYRRNLGLVLVLAVAVGVPATLVSLAADRLATIGIDQDASAWTIGGRVALGVVGVSLGTVGGTVLAGVLDAAMGEVGLAHLGGRHLRPRLRGVRELRIGTLIAADLLVTAIVIAGLLLLVVPGLLAIPLLALTGPLVSMEGLGPLAALRRSAGLVRRALPSVIVAIGIPALALGLVDAVVSSAADPRALRVALSAIVAILAAPYLGLVKVVVAHSLRASEALGRPAGHGRPRGSLPGRPPRG